MKFILSLKYNGKPASILFKCIIWLSHIVSHMPIYIYHSGAYCIDIKTYVNELMPQCRILKVQIIAFCKEHYILICYILILARMTVDQIKNENLDLYNVIQG